MKLERNLDSATQMPTNQRQRAIIARGTMLVLAMAAGISVANVYFAQPLLDQISLDFGIDPANAGLVITLTQVGYAIGLVLLVPLGDFVSRRRLILSLSMLSAIALTVVATAKTAVVFFAGVAIVGLLAVNVQVLVACAATLVLPQDRGRAVGMVTSGVVIGILAARSAAGVLTDIGGWRAVYLTSAFLMIAITWRLMRALPRTQSAAIGSGYIAAIVSIPALFLHDRVLLLRGCFALLVFAAFSTFWTALVLPLSSAPFFYTHAEIGLLGLVGMAGAIAATKTGTLVDRGFGEWTTGSALSLLLASWGLIVLLPFSVPLMVVGVLLLDLAVQAVHVANQGIILAHLPKASGRVIGGYMVFYSIGSALGAMTATSAFSAAGWPGVSILGAAYSAAALLLWVVNMLGPAYPRR